jgi:hypothetical protein
MSGPPSVTSIFKDRMHPEFVIKAAHGAVSVDVNAVLKDGCFYMMMTSKSVKLTQFFLQLVSGKILMSYAADKPILAYIDIEYSRIKFVENAEKCGRFLHAIRFIKGRNYEEIFHPERVVVLEWFEILKRFCILSKFRELYVIKSMIGKGNFAKVYVSSHAISNNDYAVKVFDKKLILQDKFERVASLHAAMPPLRARDDARSEAPEPAGHLRDLRRRQQRLLSGQALPGREPRTHHRR